MEIHDNIRLMRERQHLTQEEMADKLAMSPSGYAKIERGETKLYHEKLEKIADVLGVTVNQLLPPENQGVMVCLSEQTDCQNTVYFGDAGVEVSILKQQVNHQKEMLSQKENEIQALKEIVELLKERKKW